MPHETDNLLSFSHLRGGGVNRLFSITYNHSPHRFFHTPLPVLIFSSLAMTMPEPVETRFIASPTAHVELHPCGDAINRRLYKAVHRRRAASSISRIRALLPPVSLKLGMQTAIYIPNFRDTTPLSAAVPLRQNSVRGILYGRVSNPPLQKTKNNFFYKYFINNLIF